MTVLVTGASGFFGSRLVAALIGRGSDVLALDRDPAASRRPADDLSSGRVTSIRADLTERGSVDAIDEEGVSGVIHAAAVSASRDPATSQVMLDVNVGGTINALRLAHRLPACTKFLFVSSVAVYDLSRPGLVSEPDATGGGSLYGATKLAAEMLVRESGDAFGLDVGVIRPSSLWGPGEVWRPTRPFVTPIHALVEHARRREAVRPERPSAHRDWLYVDDAAQAAVRFLETTMDGKTVNVASGHPIPFGEVVDAVADVFDLEFDADGAIVDGGDDRPATISTTAIQAATGWEPPSGFRAAMTAYRQHLDLDPPVPVGSAPVSATQPR